jgi:hypothetical protein
MNDYGIWEPYTVKAQTIKTAVEVSLIFQISRLTFSLRVCYCVSMILSLACRAERKELPSNNLAKNRNQWTPKKWVNVDFNWEIYRFDMPCPFGFVE